MISMNVQGEGSDTLMTRSLSDPDARIPSFKISFESHISGSNLTHQSPSCKVKVSKSKL